MDVEDTKEESRGTLVDINLADVLQVLSVNRKTCTLFLRKDNRKGEIYLRDGNIIEARTGNLRGEEALFHLLEWEGADFFIGSSVESDMEVRIEKDFHSLMLEWLEKKEKNTQGMGEKRREEEKEEERIEEREEEKVEISDVEHLEEVEIKREEADMDKEILLLLKELEEIGVIRKLNNG